MDRSPSIVERTATPYVAITVHVTMDAIGDVVPPLTQEVFAWLESRGIKPTGAPFWKYNIIDMERDLEIETGLPIAEPVDGDARVHFGVLPEGRYVTLMHVGHPKTLMDATARLLKWADGQGLEWDVSPSPQGERWRSRLEIYYDEPGQDMNEWETELAFRLADQDAH
ncbi:GyrI-like domain-containing protein [Microlunatus sp. Gsoil 973]|jgi:effector-binding domain-containing protein|uniref:GyrI-like domain-containing protein n=1 Tax=Microlunatus sp. Gsoil 973 TaxID=2672569 RepID=UPI0012B4B0C2|nr:GyrI-like domain-containing protein [Microlunatus sp. Gsoil 973]QGN32235.1 GyrI-like domain-containing protein [Microlunatus sp. Gsoil 973]